MFPSSSRRISALKDCPANRQHSFFVTPAAMRWNSRLLKMTIRSLPADRNGAQVAMAAGFGSLLLIGGALGFQYLDGIVPCEMCHWQRWPHIAAAFLGIVGGTFWTRGGRTLAWI